MKNVNFLLENNLPQNIISVKTCMRFQFKGAPKQLPQNRINEPIQ